MISADINCFLSSEQTKSYLKLSFTKQQIGWCCRVEHTHTYHDHHPSGPTYLALFLAGFFREKMDQCSEALTEDRTTDRL